MYKVIMLEYQQLQALHGENNVTPTDVQHNLLLKDELDCSIHDIEKVLNYKDTKKYGLINMRAQPVHFGHEHIINEVLLDGRLPIICLGDDSKDKKRNPLTFKERRELIKLIFPNVEMVFMKVRDSNDWDKWFNQFLHIVHNKDVVFYYNNKEQDRIQEFTCCDKMYHNEFYTQIFKDQGFKTKQIEFAGRTDIHIDADATNIRDNFESFKHLLDARVYWKLKSWKW